MSDQDPNQEAPAVVPAPEPVVAPAVQPDYSQILQEIKDSSGKPKYSSVEAALTAVPHSQSHITTLEDENKTLRDENARIKAEQTVKDGILEEIRKTQPAPTETPEATAMDVKTLSDAVDERLNARDEQKLIEDRVAEMDRRLIEAHGTKEAAQAVVARAATALGVTVPDLLRIGVTSSPAVVYKLLDIDKLPTKTPQSISGGDIQPSGHEEPARRKTADELRRDFFSGTQDKDLSRVQQIRKELGGS